VDAIATTSTQIVATGRFDSAGGHSAHAVAGYSPATATWAPLGSGLGDVASAVNDYPAPAEGLALLQTSAGLYVGGLFDRAGGWEDAAFARWAG
jgi:hypothetical protein